MFTPRGDRAGAVASGKLRQIDVREFPPLLKIVCKDNHRAILTDCAHLYAIAVTAWIAFGRPEAQSVVIRRDKQHVFAIALRRPGRDLPTLNADHQVGISRVPFAFTRSNATKKRSGHTFARRESITIAAVADDEQALVCIPRLGARPCSPRNRSRPDRCSPARIASPLRWS